MRRIPGYFVVFCLVGALMVAAPADAPAAPERGTDPEIEALQREIDARGQHWTAKRNWTSDLTEEEFEGLLGLRIPPEVARRFAALNESQFPVRPDLPATFDWRDADGMTAVKHQGGCGSCWDFAATGCLEAVIKIHEGIEYDLSEQQILSCATPEYGCDGGWMAWAWGYVRENGAVLESCMPYEADDTVPCYDGPCEKVALTSEWIDVPNSEAALKTAIMTAPIAITFRVYSNFGDYGSGCYEHEGDDPPNHAVVCLGWDDSRCGGEGAWLCKNSWGEGFGDLGGYFWIKYGTCNFASTAQLLYYYDGTQIVYKGHDIDDGIGNGRGRDGIGDGDGRADPGETISFAVTLKNDLLAPIRTGVSATLATSSDHVTITQGSSSYGELGPGESADGVPAFEFTVDEFAPVGEEAEFVLTISADMTYTRNDTFALVLGPVPVLLVDDDAGESTQSYFQHALENNGYAFGTWIEELDGDIPLTELERYAVVVWDNGWGGKLGDANRDALEQYLDAGRPLMLSGEDIGWFMNYQDDPLLIGFYEDYLHADYIEDDSGYRNLDGIPGDPIGDGLSFTLNGEGCAMNQFYPSEIDPRSGAQPVFEYAPGLEGAIRIDAAHKLVYLAFGLEGVTNSADRDTIMRRSVEWLAGGAWPDTEQPEVTLTSPVGGEELAGGETHEITWSATDNVGVTSIDILCSWDSGVTFPDVVATGLQDDGSFIWSVPDTSSTTSRIRVIARDAAGLAWYDDSDGDFTTTGGTGIEDGGMRRFSLEQNVPNPFNPVTHISYSIPRTARVELRIYDVSGKVVRQLVDAELPANDYVAVWNGRTDAGQASASGIYFYRLTADGQELARKMILLR